MRNDYCTQWDDIFSFWFWYFAPSNSGKLFSLPSAIKRPSTICIRWCASTLKMNGTEYNSRYRRRCHRPGDAMAIIRIHHFNLTLNACGNTILLRHFAHFVNFSSFSNGVSFVAVWCGLPRRYNCTISPHKESLWNEMKWKKKRSPNCWLFLGPTIRSSSYNSVRRSDDRRQMAKPSISKQ